MSDTAAVILVEEDAVCFEQDAGCPRRWQALQPGGTESTRVCGTCGRTVYYCDSKEEARSRSDRLEAVAMALFNAATPVPALKMHAA